MKQMRAAIQADAFDDWAKNFYSQFQLKQLTS
jgi:hypothetical protein